VGELVNAGNARNARNAVFARTRTNWQQFLRVNSVL
jgi:hypothetical protein